MRRRFGVGVGIAAHVLAVFAVALAVRAGVPPLVLALSPDVSVALFTPIIAALILQRHPGHNVGRVLLLAGVSSSLYGFSAAASATLAAGGGDAQAVLWLTWVSSWVWYPSFAVMSTLVPLLFPDGRPPHAVFVPVFWLAVGVMALRTVLIATAPVEDWSDTGLSNPAGIAGTATLDRLLEPGLDVLWPAIVTASVLSLVVRWVQGDAVLRAQVGWVALAAVAGAAVQLVTTNGTLLAIAVPLACLVAITRHGLFSIDRFVVRAIVYGALALLVTVLHFGVALVSGGLVGIDGDVLGLRVGVTLVAVLLFQPVHRWLDRAVDRLVHGRRTAPYEVLARLARSLADTLPPEDVPATISTAIQTALDRPADVLLGPTLPRGAVTSFPVEHAGSTVAHIVVDVGVGGTPLRPDEERLVVDVAAQCGPVLRNLDLRRQLQDQLSILQQHSQDLRDSRARLVSAQDRERRRLERDLHDGVQQRLLALGIELGQQARAVPEGHADALRTLQAQAEDVTQELRRLVRGMYPPALTDLGLEAALRAQITHMGTEVRLLAALPSRCPPATETAVYFACLEAITNAARHSGADLLEVELAEVDGQLVATITDTGTGFDVERARRSGGQGLYNLEDRCGAMGGHVTIESSPGWGTVVTLRVPTTAPQQDPHSPAPPSVAAR